MQGVKQYGAGRVLIFTFETLLHVRSSKWLESTKLNLVHGTRDDI